MTFQHISVVALAAAIFAGCGQVDKGQQQEKPAPPITPNGEWFPGKMAAQPVTLHLANIELTGNMTLDVDGNTRKLQVVKDGAVMETEVYDVGDERIALSQFGTGERLEPPMPLLGIPPEVGQTLEWEGHIIIATRKIPASASVSSEAERLELATGPMETVHVTVNLEIKDGSPEPAKRKLQFWFAKGYGPIKRDFGNQVREPRVK